MFVHHPTPSPRTFPYTVRRIKPLVGRYVRMMRRDLLLAAVIVAALAGMGALVLLGKPLEDLAELMNPLAARRVDALSAVRRLAAAEIPVSACVSGRGNSSSSTWLNVIEIAQRSHLHFRTAHPQWLSYTGYHDSIAASAMHFADWAVVHVSPKPFADQNASVYAPPVYFGPAAADARLVAPPFGLWSTTLFVNASRDLKEGNASTPQVREPQPPMYFIAAAMATINAPDVSSCSGVVFCSCGCKPSTTVSSMSLRPGGKDPSYLPNVTVFLHNPYPSNLYHLLVEILPRLETVEAVLKDTDLAPLLVLPYLNDIPICKKVVEFITAVFDVPRERMVHLLHGQLTAKVVVVPMPAPCLDQYPLLLSSFRSRVFQRLPSAPRNSSKRAPVVLLGLTVRPKKRAILNFNDLRQRLAQHVFPHGARVVLELVPATIGLTHSFLKQAATFHRFDVVFGAHGSNLANLMWMRPGSHVIEVMARSDGNMCYYRLCSQLGIVHHLMLHNRSKDAPFAVDVSEVIRHVEHAVAHVMNSRRYNLSVS